MEMFVFIVMLVACDVLAVVLGLNVFLWLDENIKSWKHILIFVFLTAILNCFIVAATYVGRSLF